MPINTIATATKWTGELDKKFVQSSVTGFFTDNALRSKFVGAKTVIISDLDAQGLLDYDKDTGFSRGAVTVTGTPYTMLMDRARSLQIDREDMDETGIAGLAGKILGEYVRTRVVPECDAYVLSKLAGTAATRGNLIDGDITKPFEALSNLITEVRENVGYSEELVAFLDSRIYNALQNSNEISRMINVADFKHGDVNIKVKSLNGVALLPVVSERMKTAYTFASTSGGGFTPAANARSIYMLVLPKKGAHLVKKSETMRIFTPKENIDADAYKFDYRIYYDVFVKKSGLDAVWAWISPTVTISTQPADASKTAGSISGSVSVSASASSGTLSYQWYSADDATGANPVKIAGATSSSMTIPTTLTAGKYYCFCKLKLNGIDAVRTNVATITVS